MKFLRLIGNTHLNGNSVVAYEADNGDVILKHEKNGNESGATSRVTREFYDDNLDGYTGVRVLTEALELCGVEV